MQILLEGCRKWSKTKNIYIYVTRTYPLVNPECFSQQQGTAHLRTCAKAAVEVPLNITGSRSNSILKSVRKTNVRNTR